MERDLAKTAHGVNVGALVDQQRIRVDKSLRGAARMSSTTRKNVVVCSGPVCTKRFNLAKN